MVNRKATGRLDKQKFVEIFEEYYVREKLGLGAISKKTGISKSTLARAFKELMLPTRSNKAGTKYSNLKISDEKVKSLFYQLYIGKGMSILEVSELASISASQFYARCVALGLPLRSNSEAKKNTRCKKELILKKMYKRYLANSLSIREIAAELQLSRSQVYKEFKRCGYELTQLPGSNLTKSEVNYIVEEYVDGKSPREIAESLGGSASTIRKVLKRNNVVCRDLSEAINLLLRRGRDKSRRSINSELNLSFLEYMTPQLAWFLGAVYSDGSIGFKYGPNKRTSSFSLASIDKDFVEKLGNLVGLKPSKSTLSANTESYIWTLRCSNKVFVDSLARIGVQQNKSATVKIPEGIPSSLLRHFIRGYFEGDGHVGITDNGRLRFSLSSKSKDIMYHIAKLLYHQADIGIVGKRYSRTHINPDECPCLSVYEVLEPKSGLVMYKIETSSYRALEKLFYYLYNDVTTEFRMDRKFLIFCKGLGI